MMRLDLYRIFEVKGVENPAHFLMKNGFTRHTTSRLLDNSMSSVSFKNLETLCLILHCTTDDLFSWREPSGSTVYKDHVINKLRRGESKGNIAVKLKELLMHRPEEVQNFVDALSQDKIKLLR